MRIFFYVVIIIIALIIFFGMQKCIIYIRRAKKQFNENNTFLTNTQISNHLIQIHLKEVKVLRINHYFNKWRLDNILRIIQFENKTILDHFLSFLVTEHNLPRTNPKILNKVQKYLGKYQKYILLVNYCSSDDDDSSEPDL